MTIGQGTITSPMGLSSTVRIDADRNSSSKVEHLSQFHKKTAFSSLDSQFLLVFSSSRVPLSGLSLQLSHLPNVTP
jgi:hypothetical protein